MSDDEWVRTSVELTRGTLRRLAERKPFINRSTLVEQAVTLWLDILDREMPNHRVTSPHPKRGEP